MISIFFIASLNSRIDFILNFLNSLHLYVETVFSFIPSSLAISVLRCPSRIHIAVWYSRAERRS